jgi:uncharacterized protein (DUF2164 family)
LVGCAPERAPSFIVANVGAHFDAHPTLLNFVPPLCTQNTLMPFTFSKEDTQQAVESIQRYFNENMDEPIGSLPAELLLNFFAKEIGSLIYNQAVRDAQERLHARVAELDLEVHEDEFQYWRAGSQARKTK